MDFLKVYVVTQICKRVVIEGVPGKEAGVFTEGKGLSVLKAWTGKMV
jgi:hypothetical protein